MSEVSGDDSTYKISEKMGGKAKPSTVARWQTTQPDGPNVSAFARAYQRPVQEALVAAGIITPEEAQGVDLADLDDEALLLELLRRVRARKAEE